MESYCRIRAILLYRDRNDILNPSNIPSLIPPKSHVVTFKCVNALTLPNESTFILNMFCHASPFLLPPSFQKNVSHHQAHQADYMLFLLYVSLFSKTCSFEELTCNLQSNMPLVRITYLLISPHNILVQLEYGRILPLLFSPHCSKIVLWQILGNSSFKLLGLIIEPSVVDCLELIVLAKDDLWLLGLI